MNTLEQSITDAIRQNLTITNPEEIKYVVMRIMALIERDKQLNSDKTDYIIKTYK